MNNDQEDLLVKRFQTTMIGSLYQFEQAFGYLWGFDKDEEDLTEIEQRFKLKWENVRYNILNNGNNQLRAAIKDFDKLGNETNKYHYKYNFNDKKERGQK
jgi:hypothetical protein